MKQVSLKHEVIGGHLLKDLIVGKWYDFYNSRGFKGFVLDETGNKVYISNTCLKTHLKERHHEV